MAVNDQFLELLRRTQLLEPLDDGDRRAMLQEMREVSFDAGQVIFTRGDPGREVYLVVAGRVRLSVLTAEGRELSFAHAEPGAIFGEIAMLDEGPRSADATAVVKTQALSLGRAAFMRLAQSRPHLVDAIFSIASRVSSESSDTSPIWGTYHAAGSGVASWHDLAAATLASPPQIADTSLTGIGTADYPTRARRPQYSVLDCGKLEHAFGLRLPDWREGVAECVERLSTSA